MCGLAAVLRWDGKAALPMARDMMARARHRGPDGQGELLVHAEPGFELAFAHARLAILGRGEQGAQPFVRGNVTLVFNGEIYNFAALRDELEREGHRVRGAGDTEVLAAAWEAWGPGCLARLDGMFAVVAWDGSARRLYAARDAFAIKPLHMLRTSAGLAFASEIKQFRGLGDWTARPDLEMVGAFLALGLQDFDPVRTFFADATRIEAGTVVEFDPAAGPSAVPSVRRFADPSSASGPSVVDPSAARELVRREFGIAVAEHMVAEVPVGSCASGGTDSSALVVAATAHLGRGLDLFHARTAVDGMDESGFARDLARVTGSRLHVVDITPDELRGSLDAVVRAQDEPFSDASVIAQWLLMRRAREEGIPVLLDGQGADELYMGYAKYQFHHLRDLARDSRLWPFAGHALRLLLSGEAGGWRLWTKAQRYLPRAVRREGSLPLPPWARAPVGEWERWRASGASSDAVSRQDVVRWSLPLLLRYEDRNSMAHGIEARVPFVCWRMLRAARSIDPALHVRRGRVKAVLRDAVGPGLPESVRKRRSRFGFVTAWSRWTARGGPLSDWAVARAMDGASALRLDLTDSAVRAAAGSAPGRDFAFRIAIAGAWVSGAVAVPDPR